MAATMHVIFGTGSVGVWTARALRDTGQPVRAVNRSGKKPGLMPADAETVAADESDIRRAVEAARGASVVYRALGRVWFAPHAPAITQLAMVQEACRQLGIAPRVRVITPLMMRMAGLFITAARESVEMLYQFTKSFVVSSKAIE